MNNSPSSLVRLSAPQERLRIIQAGALTWRQSAGLRLSRLRVDAGADARRRCKCRSPVVAAGINRSSPRCSVCLRRVERGCLAAPPQRQARAARVCSIRLYSFCLYLHRSLAFWGGACVLVKIRFVGRLCRGKSGNLCVSFAPGGDDTRW